MSKAPVKRKTIHLYRHAQAEHNVADDYSIRDAVLTPLGRSQASSLPSSTTSLQPKVQLVVSSPLRRTLQTTLLGFPSPLKRLEAEKGTGKSTLVILPQLQECNDLPCDTGSDRSFLEKIPEFEGLDFSNLTDDWNSKKGFYAAQTDALKERSRWVRRWLRSREEDVIVVVSHGDFLRYLTRGENTFEPWANVEGRTYHFLDGDESEDEEAWLEQILDEK